MTKSKQVTKKEKRKERKRRKNKGGKLIVQSLKKLRLSLSKSMFWGLWEVRWRAGAGAQCWSVQRTSMRQALQHHKGSKRAETTPWCRAHTNPVPASSQPDLHCTTTKQINRSKG